MPPTQSALGREPHGLRRQIGCVIQQIGQFPHLNAADNIATVRRLPARRRHIVLTLIAVSRETP
jgi:ABC-type proline/glycine betaine transport system ATPase subunit